VTFDDFEQHLATAGYQVESADASGSSYLIIRNVAIAAGSHAGKTCSVGILRSTANPWVPQAAVHVMPQLVAMGTAASQASPLGPEWQYLSRRYDRVPNAKAFLAHVLTVLGEL